MNQEQLAARFGVSLRYIQEACAVYRDFTNSKTLRERYEHLIYDGSSFEILRVARAGGEATTGKPRAATSTAITTALSPLNGFYSRYKALRGEAKDAAFTDAVDLLTKRADFDFVEWLAGAVHRGREGPAPSNSTMPRRARH